MGLVCAISKVSFRQLTELEDFERTMAFLFRKHAINYEKFSQVASENSEYDNVEPDYLDGLLDRDESDESDNEDFDGEDEI